MKVTVNLKSIAKKKNSVKAMDLELENKPETVRQLIEETVKICVRAYNKRREETELLKGLTKEEIGDMAGVGKISFGINYGDRSADITKATENAIESYEDGIYRIFLNEEEAGKIDEPIEITDQTSLTFVRLTMLAGRMW